MLLRKTTVRPFMDVHTYRSSFEICRTYFVREQRQIQLRSPKEQLVSPGHGVKPVNVTRLDSDGKQLHRKRGASHPIAQSSHTGT